jgi:small subunit ribosomal protein S3
MGQKTHPFGFRLGVTEAHKSRWYAPKALFGELVIEDEKIRNYLDNRLNRKPPFAAVSDIHIERTREELKIIIKTARPGLVIGPKGAEVERMTQELQFMTGRKVAISIMEVKNPDLDAKLCAEAIGEALLKRMAFRRALKMKIDAMITSGAQGAKIRVSGRLGGAEIAKSMSVAQGRMPLSTLQARVEYATAEAKTPAGIIGIKCWIYKGMYTTERTEEESNAAGGRARARGRK